MSCKRFFHGSIPDSIVREVMTPTKNLTIRFREVFAYFSEELTFAGFDNLSKFFVDGVIEGIRISI
jgi:hypothetical protein